MLLSRALSNTPKTANSLFRRGANGSREIKSHSIAVLCLALVALMFNAAAQGATINYGNFNAPPVMFLDVTESSGTDPVPMFGPPAPFPVGLDFDPTTFTSTSTAGVADITDGQLNFTVMSGPGFGIGSISIFEAGDYSLAGPGGASTAAFAGAIVRATITQINGAPVAPIDVTPVNASVGFSLPPAAIVQPWSLGVTQNIAAALQPGQLATKVEFAINNTLVTTSEANSLAFIAKKEFRINIVPNVPEPATLVLICLGGLGVVALRRNRG
jgi:hypothetical protein